MKVIILMPLVVSFFSGLSLAKENKNIANDLMLRYNNTIKNVREMKRLMNAPV